MKNKILLSLLILSLCSFYIQGAQKYDPEENQKYIFIDSQFFLVQITAPLGAIVEENLQLEKKYI